MSATPADHDTADPHATMRARLRARRGPVTAGTAGVSVITSMILAATLAAPPAASSAHPPRTTTPATATTARGYAPTTAATTTTVRPTTTPATTTPAPTTTAPTTTMTASTETVAGNTATPTTTAVTATTTPAATTTRPAPSTPPTTATVPPTTAPAPTTTAGVPVPINWTTVVPADPGNGDVIAAAVTPSTYKVSRSYPNTDPTTITALIVTSFTDAGWNVTPGAPAAGTVTMNVRLGHAAGTVSAKTGPGTRTVVVTWNLIGTAT